MAKKKVTKKPKKTATKTAKKKASKAEARGSASERMAQIKKRYDETYGKDYFKPTKVKCPLCRSGVLVPKKGRFGPEWRCNADVKPMCKFKTETKPTGKKCKTCGSLMVAGTKTIPDRCSDKTCPNRNPHKL